MEKVTNEKLYIYYFRYWFIKVITEFSYKFTTIK